MRSLTHQPTSTCARGCHLVSRGCGNGMVDLDAGEECDPGPMDSEGCNSRMAGTHACKAARCGDGYTVPALRTDRLWPSRHTVPNIVATTQRCLPALNRSLVFRRR
jgi:hypothetical protein